MHIAWENQQFISSRQTVDFQSVDERSYGPFDCGFDTKVLIFITTKVAQAVKAPQRKYGVLGSTPVAAFVFVDRMADK